MTNLLQTLRRSIVLALQSVVVRRAALAVTALALVVMQGCCCHKYGGYGNQCGSCGGGGGVYDYGAGFAPSPVAPAPGGCPDGSCGSFPSAFNTYGVPATAALPAGTMTTAAAPLYAPGYVAQPVPMTAAIEPVPVR